VVCAFHASQSKIREFHDASSAAAPAMIAVKADRHGWILLSDAKIPDADISVVRYFLCNAQI